MNRSEGLIHGSAPEVGHVDSRTAEDLVARQLQAPAPNRLWVADLTYVKTFAFWVYVAFIIDVYSRFIVGWQASRSLRSDLAINAVEMAMWNRQRAGADPSQVVHHSDRGGPIPVDPLLRTRSHEFGLEHHSAPTF